MTFKQAVIFNVDVAVSTKQTISQTARLVLRSQVPPLSESDFKAWQESNFEVEPFFAQNNEEMVRRIQLARDAGVRCTFFKDKLGLHSAVAIGPAESELVDSISGLLQLPCTDADVVSIADGICAIVRKYPEIGLDRLYRQATQANESAKLLLSNGDATGASAMAIRSMMLMYRAAYALTEYVTLVDGEETAQSLINSADSALGLVEASVA